MKQLLTVFILLLASACSSIHFPWVYRLTIQQGNVITQTMIDKLKPGMTRRQVHYVLGEPVLDDPLNQQRWDYVYTIQVPGRDLINKKLRVYFINERLSYFEGNFAPTDVKSALTPEAT